MNYIVIDLEFTPTPNTLRKKTKFTQEIIEIGAVKLNDNYEVIDTFDILIKPQYAAGVSPFVRNLTGITNNDLQSAPSFKKAMYAFVEWIGYEPYRIYQWSDTDKKKLIAESMYKCCYDEFSSLLDKHFIDLQRIFQRISKLHKLSLERALNSLNIEINGELHSAVDDAYNTSQILMLMKDKEKFNKRINQIHEYMNPTINQASSIGDALGDQLAKLYELVA